MDAKIESGIRIAKFTAIVAAILNVVAVFLITPSDRNIPSHIIGAVLFLVCACGIARKSRFCAMAAFFLSVAVAVYQLPDVINNLCYIVPHGGLSTLVFYAYVTIIVAFSIIAVLLYRGIWATIVYHDRHDRAESSVPPEDDT